MYVVRQSHPAGGGCFPGRRAARPAPDLVCPLCAHESGDSQRKTAWLSLGKYLECQCGRFCAILTESGESLVPGIVSHALVTGLDDLPAIEHSLVVDGVLLGGGVVVLARHPTGAFGNLVAALSGDGSLTHVTRVDESPASASCAHNRFPVLVVAGAIRSVEDFAAGACAASSPTLEDDPCVDESAPHELSRLLLRYA